MANDYPRITDFNVEEIDPTLVYSIGENNFLNILPAKITSKLKFNSALSDTLAPGAYRGFNDDYEKKRSVINERIFDLHPFGNKIPIDKKIAKADPERADDQLRAGIRGVTADMVKAFMKGKGEIKGIQQYNLQDYNNEPDDKHKVILDLAAGGLKIDSDTNRETLLQYIRKAQSYLTGIGSIPILVMGVEIFIELTNSIVKLGLGGSLNGSQAFFDTFPTRYNGVPIILTDKDSQGNEILDFDEKSKDTTNSDCGSIYLFALSIDEGVGILLDEIPNYKFEDENINELYWTDTNMSPLIRKPLSCIRVRGIRQP